MSTKVEKENKKKEEDWMQKKWRPMMAMMYMTVCFFDFVIFPIMFTVVQFWETQASNDAFRQWQPLTLVGAGLFHMAMGAVLGITAWSRGQEKMAGMAGSSTPSLGGSSSLGGGSMNSLSAPTVTPSLGSSSLSGSSFGSSSMQMNNDPVEPVMDANPVSSAPNKPFVRRPNL